MHRTKGNFGLILGTGGMSDSVTKIRRELKQLGWSTELTRGGHIRCDHPLAAYPVFAAGTPSDRRAWKNLQALLKRAIAAGASGVTAPGRVAA
jgi:predicted RNA binding protein YcfA (HicA-like mRNA interferase family)